MCKLGNSELGDVFVLQMEEYTKLCAERVQVLSGIDTVRTCSIDGYSSVCIE